MGRNFGTYSGIQYELWEEDSMTPAHPTFDLKQTIDDYEQEAVQVLKSALVPLKTRWPYPRKERPENKIDGAIALIMAIGMRMTPDENLSLDEFLKNAVMA